MTMRTEIVIAVTRYRPTHLVNIGLNIVSLKYYLFNYLTRLDIKPVHLSCIPLNVIAARFVRNLLSRLHELLRPLIADFV